MDLVLMIGYIALLSIAWRVLSTAWKLFRCYVLTSLGFVKDLKEYGEWVVVTGATDGIGKEYALQFAQRGFNIVLISRNNSKLELVAKEIEDKFQVEVKTICFDFCEPCGYEKVESRISHLDIGILVNNVGTADMRMRKFHECSLEKMFNMVHINNFSCMGLTHMVLKGMVQRKRGAVVHISAGAVYFDYFLLPVYAATKIFLNKLVKSLQLDYSSIIDHQIVIPFGVATKMINEESGITVATARKYVEGAIATIGIAEVTHGYIVHEIMAVLLKLLPQFVITYLVRKLSKKMKEKDL